MYSFIVDQGKLIFLSHRIVHKKYFSCKATIKLFPETLSVDVDLKKIFFLQFYIFIVYIFEIRYCCLLMYFLLHNLTTFLVQGNGHPCYKCT